METTLYIRVRGRVLGPYEQEKLNGMARRGKLSRLHEVSVDRVNWVRASDYPELFTPSPDLPTFRDAGTDLVRGQTTFTSPTGGSVPGSHDTNANSASQWRYMHAGAQYGPVGFSDLQVMAATGRLDREDLVWAEGTSNWQPASTVSGLTWQRATRSESAADAAHSGSPHSTNELHTVLPAALVRAAVGSRGWVLFVAVVMFIMTGLMCLSGIMLMVQGARLRTTSAVSAGVFSLLAGIATAVGGFLLTSYAGRLGGLRYSQEPLLLEQALDSLRIFWLYIGICLIVLMVFLTVSILLQPAILP